MTKEERQQLMNVIIEEYKNTPDDKKCINTLSKKYKVKNETIKKYLDQAGIEVIKNHNRKNPEKTKLIEIATDEYINTPEYERSAAATAKKYGINRKTIIEYAKKRGFTPTQHHNKPLFDNTVFDIIDSEEKAYWLGFMYADGCVSSKENAVSLSLAQKDIEHLKLYNKFLNYPKGCVVAENGVSKTGETLWKCTTCIRDTHLWEALIDKGCVPNKSLILTFPSESQVPKHLLNHFIRGYCDGDGSLGIYNKGNDLSFIGTYDFLSNVRDALGVYGSLYHKNNKSEEVYVLRFSCGKAYAVAKKLYENSNIYLERKYNIYLQMCPSSLKEDDNKSSKNGEDCNVNTVLNLEITKGSESV